MENWMIWLIAAGIVVIFEMFTGSFYLLMISFGLASGGLAAWYGYDINIQLIVAAIVGAVATYSLRRSKLGTPQKTDAARDPNVHMDIGNTIIVNEWIIEGGGKSVARVMYRGAMWDVDLEPGAVPKPGTFTIHELRGSRLIVTNAPE
jgi:membrane protein implicated in regulation of membrane protease activity